MVLWLFEQATKIVNDRTKELYTLGLSDDEKARTWKEEVKDVEECLAGLFVELVVETSQ
ncbi:hypothetical protein [Listeria seeligeri]|uniref:hypothetical protein n=1 Tax=Listeria seeligeri TaxID=1640 RepID=UPI0019412171|nr:hypothetical protein [Listeria seeligeri]